MCKNDFFDNMCVEYYERILKYCFLSLNDEEGAKDITQEVFIVLFRRLDEVYNHPNPGGFLFKTAQNLIKGRKREICTRLLKEISAEDRLEFIADNRNDIFSVMDKAINEYDYIMEIIDSLSEDKRQLYEMYYVNKMPMTEIAERLDVDYNALRMRFVRLRKEIKRSVKKLAEENF